MSEDLIRRSDAIKAMQECFQLLARQRMQAVKMIEAIPSADRPQGEWIALDENDISGYWKCSACGTPTEAIGAKKLYKFCPNCGSKMRGEHDD